jgi:hypothetical protein
MLVIVEAGIQTFGLDAIYGDYGLENTTQCMVTEAMTTVRLIYFVSTGGIVTAGIWIFFVGVLLFLSKHKKPLHIQKYHDLWTRRLEYLCCKHHLNLTNGNEVLADVAKELADYFHDVDWAPSDMLVGLILLKREQKEKRLIMQEQRRLAFLKAKEDWHKTGGNSIEDFDNLVAPVWDRVCRHEPLRPLLKLNMTEKDLTSTMYRKRHHNIEDVYGFRPMMREDIPDILHIAPYAEYAYGLTEATAHCGKNLIYFSEKNDIYRSPYFVAVDPIWKCVVIAIRGTYSAADFMVDLKCDTAIFEIPELPSDLIHYTHHGILETAKTILKDLKEFKILDKLLKDPISACTNYDLVLTGHSLGGAVATLLTFFLRRDGYPNARCYSYDPPGMVLSEEAADYFDEFTVSVITGDDLVARLSKNSVQVLKKDISRMLDNCHLPKWQIFGSSLGNALRGNKGRPKRPQLDYKDVEMAYSIQPPNLSERKARSPSDTSIQLQPATVNNSISQFDIEESSNSWETKGGFRAGWLIRSFSPILREELRRWMSFKKSSIQDSTMDSSIFPHPPMFIPGRILYIEKYRLWHDDEDLDLPWTSSRYSIHQALRYEPPSEGIKSNANHDQFNVTLSDAPPGLRRGKYAYTPRWANRHEFQEIKVSRTMVSDHFPFPILKEFREMPNGRKLRIVKSK